MLVGGPLTPRYLDALRELADTLAPGAVTIEQGLDDAELAQRYRAAHVFVCLSEHEGFCIPLLEAFHMGVPVVARPIGGIPEVAGDAALLVEDDDLAVVAELVKLVVEDQELRVELRAQRWCSCSHPPPENRCDDPARSNREPVSAPRPRGEPSGAGPARRSSGSTRSIWFGGRQTRGFDDTAQRLDILSRIPEYLSGKTVLDVGAWDGYFSFEAERRGAARVVAPGQPRVVPTVRGSKRGLRPRPRRARLARRGHRDGGARHLDRESVGRFDVVLFLGVLYHMRHPLVGARERIASVTDELLVVETHVDMPAHPADRLWPCTRGHDLGFDPTNWWGPNPKRSFAMVRDDGIPRTCVS